MGRRDALIEKFRAITGERIVKLNRGIVALEDNPEDAPVVADVAREIHTLKGEAKLLGFAALSTLAHKLEALMTLAEADGYRKSSDAVELIFGGFDLIDALRLRAADDVDALAEAEAFVVAADRVLERGASQSTVPINVAPAEAVSSEPPIAETAAAPPVKKQPSARAGATAGTTQPGPISTLHEASFGAPGTSTPPDTNQGADRVEFTHETVDVGIRVQLGRLERLAGAADELMISHMAKAQHLTALSHVEAEAQEVLRSMRSLTSRLARVGNSQTAAMHEIAADTLSTRNRQELLVRELQTALRRLTETMADDQGRVEAIEVEVRDLRLVPLARLFDAYPRAVRDMSRELGKRVRLEVSGSDVEVDHAVLERIAEPLVHLIRNAVDHGVESPEARAEAGKPEEATLRLRAAQSGPRVLITVEDDGCGIDLDAVLRRARQRQLVEAHVEELDPSEAADLLFLPGFSTKVVASETSGRGVGLDVVKSRVEAMGGVVQLRFQTHAWTRCELSIPLSLVRAPTLVVVVGDALYGVPPAHAPRVMLSSEADRVQSGGGTAVRIDGSIVRLSALSTLLGVVGHPRDDGAIVMLEYGDQRLAVEVDGIVAETHVIQHDLAPLVNGIRMSSGTAVIGQGELVVLLNVAELMRAAEVAVKVSLPPVEMVRDRSRRVLVVDDSELTRDILVNLVSRFGYQCVEAVDGQDALKRLADAQVDLVLTDLEMPVLDGFGLLDRVRRTPQHKDLPVVVCSTRGSDVDKQRAASLGADAYVVKARFNEDELKRTLERFLSGPQA